LPINSLFKREFKYSYVKSVISLEQLLQDYDDKLFHKATYGNHDMHHLLPSSSGYRQKATGIKITFFRLFARYLPNLTPIGPYLRISGRRTQFFCDYFAPQGRLAQPIFLKFTEFMCSFSFHIRLKFGEIRFKNQKFVTE